jgi:hypothetical protein
VKLPGDSREAVGRVCEVGAAEVAGAGSGAEGCVREAEPVPRQIELLAGREQAGSEARVVEEAPEVVPRIGEVRARGGRHTAGVDATEDRVETGREHVRDGARRCHAFGANP